MRAGASAAVSDGVNVWEAAKDMNALIDSLGGELPGPELMRGEGVPLEHVKLLAPIPEPRQDVICLGMNYRDHSVEAERWGKDDFVKNAGRPYIFPSVPPGSLAPGTISTGILI